MDTDGTSAVQKVGGFVAPLGADTVLFGGGPTPIAESPSGNNPVYLARRVAGVGWQTESLLPPGVSSAATYELLDSTPDLSASVWDVISSYTLSTPPPGREQRPIIRYRDADGSYETIVTDPTESGQPGYEDPSSYAGMSQDGSRVVYSSYVDPPGLPGSGGERKVYRWSPGGHYERLASGPGSPLAGCNAEAAGVIDFSVQTLARAKTTNNVSADGGTVFLQSGETPSDPACPSPTQVYVTDGEGATLVSQAESAAPGEVTPGQAPAYFQGASADGRTAYFETAAVLTSEDHDTQSDELELYRWEAPAAGGAGTVTCVTCGHAAGQGSLDEGAVAVSPSGSYVYYETLETEGEYRTPLYVYHDGVSRPIFEPGTTGALGGQGAMDASGNELVFPREGIEAAGLYRAEVTPTGVQVAPLARDAEGKPVPGTVERLFGHFLVNRSGDPAGASGIAGAMQGSITEDGQTIIFESPRALAPGAIEYENESPIKNAYVWHDGEVALIDAGSETGAGISPEGSSVFFTSAEALSAETTQTTPTLYDARVGGGFPVPAVPIPCVGEACLGTRPTAPRQASVGSGASAGGNPPVRALNLARPTKAEASRFARSGVLALALSARGPGRVEGKALLRGRGGTRVVARAARKVGADEERISLKLRLDRTAVAELRSAGHLRLTLVVTLPGAPSRRIAILLKEGN